MDRDRRTETLLPLRPVEFQILLSLAGGERHGYGIIQDARERREAAPDIGTLYRALARMLDQGLIESADSRPVPAPQEAAASSARTKTTAAAFRSGASFRGEDERRNYYRLTGAGLRVAKAEAQRLDALTRAARLGGLLKKEAK